MARSGHCSALIKEIRVSATVRKCRKLRWKNNICERKMILAKATCAKSTNIEMSKVTFFLVQSRVLTVFSQSDIGNPYSFIQFCHTIAITVYSNINVKLHNYVR